MGKYNIIDFQIGDNVHHLSNRTLHMVVIDISTDLNEVSCRWIDKSGVTHIEKFLPQELGKASDIAPRIYSI